jgi:hypothetical protein
VVGGRWGGGGGGGGGGADLGGGGRFTADGKSRNKFFVFTSNFLVVEIVARKPSFTKKGEKNEIPERDPFNSLLWKFDFGSMDNHGKFYPKKNLLACFS